MKVLALETSLDACSVALALDGQLIERFEEAPRRHIERLLPMVDALMSEAGLALTALDGIGFGAGPGSFTGVRIALAAAQGLAVGADLELAAVSSLEALAVSALEGGATRVWVAQDARMGELYAAAFAPGEGALPRRLQPDRLVRPEAIRIEGRWWLAGAGWQKYREAVGAEALPGIDTGHRFPRAGAVARLAEERFRAGEGVSPAEAEPAYLRQQVAQGGS